MDQPIWPVKQEKDPTETTTTPAAPPEVKRPPSSHLKSKTKQQTTSIQQGQPECNTSTVDPPECNPAQTEVNEVQIAPKDYSLMPWTHTLLWAKRVSKHKAPLTDKRKSEVKISINFYSAPNRTIIHCRKTQEKQNFEHFQLENPKSSTLQDESKSTL